MECNKDEALRAKEIAEKKLTGKDIAGANQFALKALKLYPGLHGLPQLLATLNVHISSKERINGEVDWYRVLGVETSADDDTIRRRYSELSFILHPNNNKLEGADGAFKILSQAWSFLSDKARRSAYDQKRNSSDIYEKVQAGQKGFNNFDISNNSNAGVQQSATHHKPVIRSRYSTFWTICNACKYQFQYHRIYLNRLLVCPSCKQPFYAVKTPLRPLNYNSSPTSRASYMQLYATEWIPAFDTNVRKAGFSSTQSPRSGPSVEAGSTSKRTRRSQGSDNDSTDAIRKAATKETED